MSKSGATNSLSVQMRSEGYIHLELQADVDNAIIYTDVSRFTQIISSMLLYPVECKSQEE